jgi:hypothetical protein
MEGIVYILCTLTALICAVLLLRGYARSRTRLLLWCGVFFLVMTVENSILFYDRVFLPVEVDLGGIRNGLALVGMGLLMYGLIWDK